jgi:hypothetical protein
MENPITQAMYLCGSYGDIPSLFIQSILIEK